MEEVVVQLDKRRPKPTQDRPPVVHELWLRLAYRDGDLDSGGVVDQHLMTANDKRLLAWDLRRLARWLDDQAADEDPNNPQDVVGEAYFMRSSRVRLFWPRDVLQVREHVQWFLRRVQDLYALVWKSSRKSTVDTVNEICQGEDDGSGDFSTIDRL